MSLSKDDIMSQFDEGVAEIERTKKRGTSNLGEMFETGVREIEKSREGLLKKAGRAVATLPPTFGAMGAGIVQYGAEAPLRGREGIVESLGLIQREGAALPKKEAVPVKPIEERAKGMSKTEIFMESLEEQYGKQVKPWGKAVEYIRGTDPVKWIMEHGAKGDVAKAMLDEDLPAEAAKLIREEKYAEAEKYLKDVKFTEHPELAQKYERDPLRKAIEVGGEKAILDPTIKGAAAFGKGARGLVEDIGPVSKRGTAAYYVAGAIQGVGPMALTVGAAIIAKKPYLALPMMFPQVLGQGYSEDRAKGKSALDAAKENTFKAFTEIASEAVPIGIAIKVGGKFTTKVFKTGAAEGLQETINEGINIAYEEGILDEHTPAHEIGKRLIDAQIIGSVGGMGMGAMTHPLSGKEVDSPDIVKKDILDSITEVYGKGEQTAEQTVESLTEGYRSEVFGDADLSEISKAHPELKSGIDAMTESVRTDKIKNGLIGAVNEGLSSGEFQGQEFTADDAISFIKKGLDNNILVAEDIDSLKEQFPQIKDELNTVIAERATSQIEPEISEPEISEPEISEPEISEPEAPEYKDKDIEAIYKEAKERVRIEPVTLKELQDRFTERKGREATDREQEELNRVYEKAKKRSEFMAKREAKKVQPTKEEAEKVQPTKEEAEFEAYQPDLPPSKPEVRFRKTELTYPRGEKYVAGKEAPEGLVVEHKPALSTNNTPWKTQARALNALKNGRRFKAAGYTEETHEVVPVKGGFGIAKKVVEPTIERPAGGKPDLDTRRLTDSSGKDVDIKVGMHVKINDSTTGVVEGFEEGVVLFKTDPINEAERAGKARPLQKMNDSNIFDIIETPVAKETKGKAPTEKAAKPKAAKPKAVKAEAAKPEAAKPEPISETKSRLLENIKSEKGSSELINDLSRLGADAVKRGHKSFKAFNIEMKAILGDAWAKVKHLARQTYFDAKRILKSERGMLGGAKAKDAPAGQLANAQRLLKEGKSEKQTWRETGWLKGAEGKWRFEIDDSVASLQVEDYFKYVNSLSKERKSKVFGGAGLKLDEVLKHPQLFKAYPELRNVVVDSVSAGGFAASWNSKQRRIHFGSDIIDKSSLLHEIQHAIQEIEDFARGGSPGGPISSSERSRLIEKKMEWIRPVDEKKGTPWSESFDKASRLVDSPAERIKIYKRLAGEIEARDTEARAKLTAKERREQMPYESQGIPRDQWIVMDGKGTSFSVEPAKAQGERLEKESTLREPGAEHSKEKELKKLGAKIRGDKVVLYRGGNVSKKELKKLRYNDYLSLVKKGKDVTGNEGAAGYGKNVIRIEVSINDIKITNGEIQYIGKAESLEGGKKYPAEIYRAYNDYHGSNYTASEIDKETNVRAVASMALEGGREEFDARLAEFMPEVTEKTKSVEPAKAQGERLKKEAGKRRLEDTGLLKETDEIVPGVTLNDFVEMATKEPEQAIGHIKTATVNKRQLIEGLRNKGMGALGRAPKSERSAMRKNLGAVLEAVEKADIKYSKKAKGPVYVRLGTLSDEVLNKMNKYLKSLGYDTRGKQDVYEMLKGDAKRKGLMNENREIKHPDWANAYERAMKGVEVRKKKLKIKKEVRSSAANVNWDRIRELGKTGNINEAGYITPEGSYIDLSGKREGGEHDTRILDHREAGGTDGMQEFMSLGNIRMDANSGMLDIGAEPTAMQYEKIAEMVALHKGEIVIDLAEGLGKKKDTYYLDPSRTFSYEYSRGTSLNEIRSDVENFYAGKDVKEIKYAKKVAEKKVQVALTPDTARKEIEKKIGKKSIDALEKSGRVKFVTLDEAQDVTFEPMGDAQGFIHNDTAYLISENTEQGHAWNVLMHELGVHYGYNKIFGEKLAKEVFAAFVSENGKQTPLGKAVSEALKRVPPDTAAYLYNEEAVAYFTENEANRDLSLWKKIKARVRLWMVKHLGISPSVFTIDDYVAIAASAVRSEATIAERGRAKKTTEVTEEKLAKPVREGSLHERLGIPEGRLKRISEFSVPKMSLKDTVKKITDNPNFVKWFGGSNVIDEKGDPLVVYHGTRADFSEFLPETWGQNVSGAARNGFFFTSDPSEASGYVEGEAPGGRVMPLFLRIKKPLKLEYAQHGIDDIIKSDEDVASYLKKAQGIISKVRGIDGLILNDIGGKKGHNLYVTFESTQIKSIFNVGTFDPTKADIRYSKKEKVDLNKWADDLIAGAKKKGVVLDKPNPTPKELRESSVSVLAGLDNTKLAKPIRSFLAGMNPKGKGFGREFEKWFASPEWYQHPVMKKIVDSALAKSEKFHKLFNEFNAIDDPFAEHDTVAKTLEALARKGKMSKAAFILGRTSNDFKKLEQLLDDADVYNEKHTVESLKKDGYSEDVINAWSVVRESYDKQLDARLKPMKDLVARIKEEAAWKGVDPKDVVYPDFGEYIIDGKKRRLNLKEAILEMGNLKGVYSPRLRDPGDYVITGKKYGTVSQGGDDYVRFNRRTNSFANLLRDELESQGYTDIKVEKESRLPEETFQAVRIAEMGTVIGNAVNKGLDKYDTEQQIAFMDEVIRSASDTLKSRGSKSIMMRRRGGKAVKGYITNPLVRFVRYTGNNAAGLAKAEMGEKMIKALYGEMVNGEKVGGIDASKEGDVHSMARGYIEEQMRNAETGDKVVGIVKALTTLKFLGFNPRSVLVNLSSLTTSVPIALHAYAMDGKGSLAKIGVTLSGACKDYTKVMTGKRLSNTDEQTFIDEFQSNGYTDAQYTRDAVGNVQGAYGTAWSKLMGGSMYVFGKSEQWLRGGTALAAYRLTKKQGLSHAAASDKAILATGKAHGIYAKETLPMVAWGKGIGRLGQAFYTYMKFPHNYMQMLYDVGVRKKNMKAVIFGLAAPAVLGGVASVPMYATVIAIANAMLSSLGDDRDAEKMVYDTINEYVGSTGEEKIRGGVLGLLDIDISGSLSMGPGSIPTSLMELTGALGGAIEQVGQGIGYAASGEYGRAASKMLPQAIGNIFTAVREMKGATTSKGDVIWDENGQPYIPSTAETIKKGFGFRSSRRAQLGQTVWVSKREEGRFKETKSKIYKKIKFLTGKNEEIQLNKDVSDSISKYNKNALQTPNVTLITPASIASQVKGMTVPSSKKLARATGSERAATFENSIWADALGITEIPDSTQSEVKRLSDLGMVKYSAPPSRTINAGHGIIVRLDDEQYSRYVTDNDTVIKEAVDKIIGLPKWSKLSDKKRAYTIKYITKKGRKFVRSRIKKAILIAKIKEHRNR